MRVVVIGGNFAGFTAAIQLKRKLGSQWEVVVIDRNPDLLYIPSLIWVPFKRREVKDISIPRREVLEKRGIKFWQTIAERVDPLEQLVYTKSGALAYDQLVIATGSKVQFDIAPGVKEHACYIGTPTEALKTREKLEAFKRPPAPLSSAPPSRPAAWALPTSFSSTSKSGCASRTSARKWTSTGSPPKPIWATLVSTACPWARPC